MKQLLIVDKAESFTKYMDLIMKRLGYKLLIAKEAEKGFFILLQERPEMVICETHLPGEGGIELCRKIKNKPETSAIPVVVITTDGSGQTRKLAFDSGCAEYLTKPLQIRRLYHVLEKYLGYRRKHIRANMATQVRVARGEGYCDMNTQDVGEGGMFLITQSPDPVGTILEMSFSFPGLDKNLTVKGEVVYAFGEQAEWHSAGMGIKFVDLGEETASIISRNIVKYLSSTGS